MKILQDGQGRGRFRIRSKDNSYKWMDINGRITHDSDSNKRMILVSRDITKEKGIEQKLKEKNKELIK